MFIENFTVITAHPFGAKHICRKLNKRIIKGEKKEKKMQSVTVICLINLFRSNTYSVLIWIL